MFDDDMEEEIDVFDLEVSALVYLLYQLACKTFRLKGGFPQFLGIVETVLSLLPSSFLQCKEWGFSLRDLFGLGLGTGDYGHLTVEHASMLLRNFRSLRLYSNQGFEAAHKLQKQIFSRATNHDGSGEATSC